MPYEACCAAARSMGVSNHTAFKKANSHSAYPHYAYSRFQIQKELKDNYFQSSSKNELSLWFNSLWFFHYVQPILSKN